MHINDCYCLLLLVIIFRIATFAAWINTLRIKTLYIMIFAFLFVTVCVIWFVDSHSKISKRELTKFCPRSQFCSRPSRRPAEFPRLPNRRKPMCQNTRRNWMSWKRSCRDLPAADWITWRSCTSSSLMFRSNDFKCHHHAEFTGTQSN